MDRRKSPISASSSPTSFVAVKVHLGQKPAGISVLAALHDTSCVPHQFFGVIQDISVAYMEDMKFGSPGRSTNFGHRAQKLADCRGRPLRLSLPGL
jgi:hypothetical protein